MIAQVVLSPRRSLATLLSVVLILVPILGMSRSSLAAGVLYAAPTASGNADCSSWTDACTLQTALAAAASGDQIWAQAGLHTPGAARADTFALANGVALYGGFAGSEVTLEQRDWQTNLTVLSGDIGGDDLADPQGVVTDTAHIVGGNSYHVVTIAPDAGAATRLDGLVITAGRADGVDPDIRGGGVYNVGGDPTLAHVTLSGNLASLGGGMYSEGIYTNNSFPTFTDVTFHGNAANTGGGLHSYYFCSPTLTETTFTENVAVYEGGGLYSSYDSHPALTDSVFIGNSAESGGAIYHVYISNPSLTNVVLADNTATGNGGAIYSFNMAHAYLTNVTLTNNAAVKGGGLYSDWHAGPWLVNVTFDQNEAVDGGGMYLHHHRDYTSGNKLTNVVFQGNSATNSGGGLFLNHAVSTLTNVTMSGNTAVVSGGAVYNYDISDPLIYNTILWGNNAPVGAQIVNDQSAASISFSLIQGSGGSGAGWDATLGTDGGGNLDADPGFVDAAGGNLRLGNLSPAIDAGDNAAVPVAVTTDRDGNPRFVDWPLVADTGSGTPPIVDMGAYEASYTQVTLAKEVSPESLVPGDAITFTLAITGSDALTATQVIITDTLPTSVLVDGVVAQGIVITGTGALPAYEWEAQDLAPGHSSVITITGSLATPLAAGVYTNTARIASVIGAASMVYSSTVTYTVLNVAPAFTSTPVVAATENALYSYAIAAGDANGDALAITAPTLPGWLVLNDAGDGTATLSGTPTGADLGDHAVQLLVSDGGGLSDTQAFTITVRAEYPFRIYLPITLGER
jgi:uncharacterized repeat protein (TIGR01451 family)